MGIEDIERHKYNFRLFCMFLKQEKKYQLIKVLMFEIPKRTPMDLFEVINNEDINHITFLGLDMGYHEIDRKWSVILRYIPFCSFYWSNDKTSPIYFKLMDDLSEKWIKFLREKKI
jgi:hypothetical protein